MHDNVDRIRRGYEAFAKGDLDTIREMLAPDVVWHVPGRHALAGTYQGIDAVFGYFGQVFERSNGTFSAELMACGEIEPDLVACTVRISGDLPGGRLDTTIVQTFRSADGRTVETRGYSEDPYAIDEAMGSAITLPDARRPEPAPVRTS